MLNKVNEIISTVNFIVCNIRNIQRYVGTKDETDLETLTGRIARLEARMVDTWDNEEWAGGTEWSAEDSTTTTITEEWTDGTN